MVYFPFAHLFIARFVIKDQTPVHIIVHKTLTCSATQYLINGGRLDHMKVCYVYYSNQRKGELTVCQVPVQVRIIFCLCFPQQQKLPDKNVTNFTSDWNDGTLIGALVDAMAPGLCPEHEAMDPQNALQNATHAMKLGEDWLDVPQVQCVCVCMHFLNA